MPFNAKLSQHLLFTHILMAVDLGLHNVAVFIEFTLKQFLT